MIGDTGGIRNISQLFRACSEDSLLRRSSRFRRERHFDKRITPRCGGIGACSYRRAVLSHHRPDVRAKHNQGELPARQVLLIAGVLIGCHHHVETRLSGISEKLSSQSCTLGSINTNYSRLTLAFKTTLQRAASTTPSCA
jgi:hypothetical protein